MLAPMVWRARSTTSILSTKSLKALSPDAISPSRIFVRRFKKKRAPRPRNSRLRNWWRSSIRATPLVVKTLQKSARLNAIQLLSITNLLDVDYIVIQGHILSFGTEYQDLLLKAFREYDRNLNTAQILFSSLGGEANLRGALYQGEKRFYLHRFGEITAQRTGSEDYDVDAYFGDDAPVISLRFSFYKTQKPRGWHNAFSVPLCRSREALYSPAVLIN
jgi:hypothetical protein